MLNARSTGRRAEEPSFARTRPRAASASVARSSSRPSPVRADTGTTAASAYGPPARRPRTSSAMNAAHSSSTRSRFVRATTQRAMPSSSSTARCSSVCGMTPSSAAMHRSARSMPVEPAIIWRTKRSWPGTSTTPSALPSGSSSCAKPSSMVMPRRFSSARRSGSSPVSACTSVDLPWSMWPAVPSTTRRPPAAALMRPLPPSGRPRALPGQGSLPPPLPLSRPTPPQRPAPRSRRAPPRRSRRCRPPRWCARPAARPRA